MVPIGVLAFQGSVVEHMHCLSMLEGIEALEVKTVEELEKISGLILPGGESTTLGKLLRDFHLLEPIRTRIQKGMPVWGTCAGMVLLAEEIVGEEDVHLGTMDIRVRRNAYGSQLDSFQQQILIPEVSKEAIPCIFIRAPWVEQAGASVQVMAEASGKIVAVRQKHMLATSFHPELSQNLSFHEYFAKMVCGLC